MIDIDKHSYEIRNNDHLQYSSYKREDVSKRIGHSMPNNLLDLKQFVSFHNSYIIEPYDASVRWNGRKFNGVSVEVWE